MNETPAISPPYRIFISYTNEDKELASAINQSLSTAYPNAIDLRVDLMKEFRAGIQWRKEIDDCLINADLLLLVYTGQLKPSHSWTGYELGFYSNEIQKKPFRFPDVPREIVPISFLGAREAVTEVIEGIEFGANDVTRPDIDIAQLTEDSDKFMARFPAGQPAPADQLFDLFTRIANNIEKCTNRKTEDKSRTLRDDNLRKIIAELYQTLHSVLRQRERDDVGLQSKIIISLSDGDALTPGKVPLKATIEFQNAAEEVFNLINVFSSTQAVKRLDWATFEQVAGEKNDNQLAALWVANLKELVTSAHSGDFIDNNLLLPSWNQSTTYRAVVTRRVWFYSGRIDIHIYLFELHKRAEYGDMHTSLYLNAVAVACRYRSLFLEPHSQFAPQWMRPHANNKFRQQVMLLIRELDRVHQDTIESNLNSAEGLAEIYGVEGVGLLTKVSSRWRDAESRLRSKAAALVQCPDEQQFESVRKEFDEELVNFCTQTKVFNADYLNRSLKKLECRTEELMVELEKIMQGWKTESISAP